MRKWVYVPTKKFTVSIGVRDDKIILTAPINRWVIGKSAKWYKDYLIRKGQLLQWEELEI